MRPQHGSALTAIVAALLVLAACTSERAGIDGLYEVAGGQVDLWCDGGDGPTIMFMSAVGGDDSLLPIAEALGDEAFVCFYNRPGDGETSPPEDRRTAGEDAADLRELAGEAGIPTPMILVAHSYGGLITVVAAAEHPDDVSGVVLVDASHPDQERQLDAVLSAEQRAGLDRAQEESFPYIDWYSSLADAAAAYDDFPEIPLTVITATHGWEDCGADLPCADMQAVWLDVQDEYAALATGARHVLAETGHYVHDDDPELVLDEIRALMDRVEESEPSDGPG